MNPGLWPYQKNEHWGPSTGGDDPAIRYKRRFADKPDPKDRKQPSADLLRKLGYVEADVSKKERVDEYSRLVQKKLDEKIISSDNYDKWFDKESLVVAWLIERGAKEVLVLKEHSSLSDENKKLATELMASILRISSLMEFQLRLKN